MGSTEPLRTGQIVRYTDPDGAYFDAIIQEIEGDEAFIEYRPTRNSRFVWVNLSTLEVPE